MLHIFSDQLVFERRDQILHRISVVSELHLNDSLLFAADRCDHVTREVAPAISAGKIVVSDRWYHSSLAYQATGEDRDWIWQLNQRARKPDLTLILEVTPSEAARRREKDNRPTDAFDALETQTQVAKNYRAVHDWLGKEEQIAIIDGEKPFDTVSDTIYRMATEARKT